MTDTIGTYYYQPEKPQAADLLVNPPFACDREHQPACGTGAFLVEAAEAIKDGAA